MAASPSLSAPPGMRFTGSLSAVGGGVVPVLLFDSAAFVPPAPGSAVDAISTVCTALRYSAEQASCFTAMLSFHVTQKVEHPEAVAAGLLADDVFALAWYTSDVRCLGLPVESNGWYVMNERLRRRDVDGLALFKPIIFYVYRGLRMLEAHQVKSRRGEKRTVWRGLRDVRLTAISSLYAPGQLVCWPSFTSTSVAQDTMVAFLGAGSGGTMIKLEVDGGADMLAFSMVGGEHEVLLPPNTVIRIKSTVTSEMLDGFPGVSLPRGVDLVIAEQTETPAFGLLLPASCLVVPPPPSRGEATNGVVPLSGAVPLSPAAPVEPTRPPAAVETAVEASGGQPLPPPVAVVVASPVAVPGGSVPAGFPDDLFLFGDPRPPPPPGVRSSPLRPSKAAVPHVDPFEGLVMVASSNATGTSAAAVSPSLVSAAIAELANSSRYPMPACRQAPLTGLTVDARVLAGPAPPPNPPTYHAMAVWLLNRGASFETAAAWWAAGRSMLPGDTALVNGRQYSKRECYLAALRVDPHFSLAWSSLGATLVDPSDTAAVAGRLYSRKDCCLEAVRMDVTQAQAWFNLGAAMSTRDAPILAAGRAWTRSECLAESLRMDPEANGIAWYLLGESLLAPARRSSNREGEGRGEATAAASTTAVNPPTATWRIRDQDYRAVDCFVRAVSIDASIGAAWASLGAPSLLADGETVSVRGSQWSRLECLVESLRCDRSRGSTWLQLGNQLGPDEVVVVQAVPSSKLTCYAECLRLEPAHSGAWYELGLALVTSADAAAENESRQSCSRLAPNATGGASSRPKIVIEPAAPAASPADMVAAFATAGPGRADGSTAPSALPTSRACFVEALAHDPANAAAWRRLARDIADADKMTVPSRADGTTVSVRGKSCTARDCYVEAVKLDPTCADAWSELGELLGDGETIHIIMPSPARIAASAATGTFTKVDCLLEVVKLKATAKAWNALGCAMGADAFVRLSATGEERSKRDCFVEAIRLEATSIDAWTNLGWAMSDGTKTVRVTDQRESVTRRECFAEVLRLAGPAATAAAWHNLSKALFDTPSQAVRIGRRDWRYQDCCLEAIRLDPGQATYWSRLADFVKATDRVTVAERSYTQRDLYLEAAKLAPSSPVAWSNLGAVMSDTETIRLLNREWTAKECYGEAIRLDPTYSVAWFNLGAALSPAEAVRIGERYWSEKECYAEVIRLDPDHAGAWQNLSRTMNDSDTVLIGDRCMTGKEVKRRQSGGCPVS